MPSELPPLPSGQKRNPASGSIPRTLESSLPRPPSSQRSAGRGSQRSAGHGSQRSASGSQRSAGSGRPLAVEEPDQYETGSRRSQGSHRSQRSNATGASSRRTGASSVGRTSSGSRMALEQLQQLEDMLIQERRAREQAELEMLTMQREKLQRDDKLQKGDQAQKQLTEIMGALQRVLSEPHDEGGIKKLQNIVRGVPVSTAAKLAANPPAAASDTAGRPSDRARGASDAASTREDEPRSFLDNIGTFDRDRQKQSHARKAARFA